MSIVGGLYRRTRAVSDPLLVPWQNVRLAAAAARDPAGFAAARDRAITRGVAWFAPQPDLEISALAALKGLHEAGIEPRLRFIDEKIANFRATAPGFLMRFFDPDCPYDPTPDPFGRLVLGPPQETFSYRLDVIMRRCLYADRLALDERFLDELATLDDRGGYGSTHVVIGGALLKQYSGIDPGKIETAMQRPVPHIIAAQRRSQSGDIFAERIVALVYAGRIDAIEPAWLLRLVRAQNADGGWSGQSSLRRPVSNQHTTALAIAALAAVRAPEALVQLPLTRATGHHKPAAWQAPPTAEGANPGM